GDAACADPQAQKERSGGDATDGGAGRSLRLRANSEEIRRRGGGDYRGVAVDRGAARTERNQFEHLLLHGGEAVAGTDAGEAQQQTPGDLSDRCHWRVERKRGNGAGGNCAGRAGDSGLQHTRGPGGSGPNVPRTEARRTDEQWRNNSIAGNGADRSRRDRG